MVLHGEVTRGVLLGGAKPEKALVELLLTLWGGFGIEDGVPGAHDGGAGDEAGLEGLGIEAAAGLVEGPEGGVDGGVVVGEEFFIPDEGGEVPFDGAGEGIFPVGPQESMRGVDGVARVGVAMEGLVGESGQLIDRLFEMIDEEGLIVRGEEMELGGLAEELEGLVEDCEVGEFLWK